jgi:hypothetical protein
MKEVDFAKLSEQYASFLVAAGGVSITVLTLVLTLGSEPAQTGNISLHQMILEQAEQGPLEYSRTFLAAALLVATACCFIGAHMMAETAAYFTHDKDRSLGGRLFLLASTNIFIAIVLILFALVLLPSASARVDAESVRPISLFALLLIAAVALLWMCLAISRRTTLHKFDPPLKCILIFSAGTVITWGVIFYCFLVPCFDLLYATLFPIALLPLVSLFYSAVIFKNDDGVEASTRTGNLFEICFFSTAIVISYTSLVIAGFKMLW